MSKMSHADLYKEFAPRAESLELKELGLDEPCLAVHYVHKLYLYSKTRGIKNSDKISQDWICTAPTFSQAFRWFRKKYNLHPAIYPIKQHWECDIRHTNKDTNSSIFSWDNEFEYEEAELACLRKLIEIVKSKQ